MDREAGGGAGAGLHLAAHTFNEFAGGGEAEAVAGELLAVEAAEGFEDAFLILGFKDGAAVGDGDVDVAVVAALD